MLDATDLLTLVKKAAIEAVEASQPSDFCFGKVTGTSPLRVKVESKMELGLAQLVLIKTVMDHGLAKGDEVILLKKKGGQKYLILDKVVNT